MLTIKIPDALTNKYHGAGLALAAITTDKKLIDFAYCRDIDPDFDFDQTLDKVMEHISESPRFKEHGRFFEVPGTYEMAFGMMSCWEFVVL